MDKVNFAVTFGVFSHLPNRKDVLCGKGGGGEEWGGGVGGRATHI